MALIVQKFGGTSIANLTRIKRVAKLIASEVEKGNKVAVVVSAMAGVTNQLIEWVGQTGDKQPDGAEYDAVVSTGEQVTCGLLALALQDLGIQARSWLGWQLGIRTNNQHQHAKIHSIDTEAILKSFDDGQVAVIAGFQGFDAFNRITTLGRGGSDTTAVALAYALQAERCDIYTDVDGVFTADPQLVANSRKLDSISYDAMLALARHGARVLQPESVELAMKCRIPLQVRSSFSPNTGTFLSHKDKDPHLVTGVSCDDDVSLFILKDLQSPETTSQDILTSVEEDSISVTLSVLRPAESGKDFIFTVKRAQLEKTKLLLHEKFHVDPIHHVSKAANIAIVGRITESNRKQVIDEIMKALNKEGLSCYGVIRYPHKLVAVLDDTEAHRALQVLHDHFRLGEENPLRLEEIEQAS